MSTPLFRQHLSPPADVRSPLYAALTQEWVGLNALPSTAISVRRWGRTQKVLAELHTPGEIVDAIDAGDEQTKDEILGALLARLHEGHQLAGRIVLQALLPKLARIAPSAHHPAETYPWPEEEKRHQTLAEFWDVMSRYPLQRRPRRVAANLALDTLHKITAGRPPSNKTILRIDEVHDELADFHTGHPVEHAPIHADNDLADVLAWALETGKITADEADLLTSTYLAGTENTRNYAATAARLGASEAAIRQRCSRAVRKLTAAVHTEMLEDPSTPQTSARTNRLRIA